MVRHLSFHICRHYIWKPLRYHYFWFIPIALVPQILLSGVIVSVSSEPGWLRVISDLLPLTYAVDALRSVMVKGADLSAQPVQLDLAVVVGFSVLMAAAAAGTLRRRLA